jgi:hypothetical protein
MHPASQLVLTAANKARNSSCGEGMRLDGELFENGNINVTSGINPSNKDQALSNIEKLLGGMGEPETIPGDGYLWNNVTGKDIIEFIKNYPISVQMEYDRKYFVDYLDLNSDMKWDVAMISREESKRERREKQLSGLTVCKTSRQYRKNSDNKKISMSAKDDECIGLDLSGLDRDKPGFRRTVREKYRKNPLLIINITDVYTRKENPEDKETLDMEDVPMITVTFPGSFDKPKTRPLFGMVWNDLVRRHLLVDYEESGDDTEEEKEI